MHLLAMPSWLTADGLGALFGPWVTVGFTLIIFVECALFVGMFFPGDSLLLLMGVMMANHQVHQPVWLVVSVLFIAAIAGNVVGYQLGKAVGPRLFGRPNARYLKSEHVEKTEKFFHKYGNKAIVLARFVPVVRSFITAVAGIARMDQRRFYLYSAIGAFIWVFANFFAGYGLGHFDWVQERFSIILVAWVIISSIPIGWEILKARRNS